MSQGWRQDAHHEHPDSEETGSSFVFGMLTYNSGLAITFVDTRFVFTFCFLTCLVIKINLYNIHSQSAS